MNTTKHDHINTVERPVNMMCYRDRTFCSFYVDCSVENCDRALTPEIEDRAQKIGMPICEFAEQPKCFKAKKDEMP